MKKSLEYIYLIVLSLEILFSLLGEQYSLYAGIFKALLMPLLALNILPKAHLLPNKILLTALFFAWLGDIFLISSSETFFIFGLGSFLIMQIFYIILLVKNLKYLQIQNPLSLLLLGLTLVYIVGMVQYLYPHIKFELFFPVLIYSIFLGTTFLLAGWNYVGSLTKTNKLLFFGAFLFLFSDSSLAINIFVQKLSYSPFFIMGTYGIAQLFLSKGLLDKNAH